MTAGRPITSRERETILRLYRRGTSYNEIAASVGRSPGSVSNVIKSTRPKKETGWPRISKDPNDFRSWGKGFYGDDVVFKKPAILRRITNES
tara:strand:- start:449 stop:724 length:276 start_codon:yes stop_codon:yes gene_type:complete